MTYCNNCGGEIPHAAMIRGRWKARYCKTGCREEHSKRIRMERLAYRKSKGLCAACGHKPPVRRRKGPLYEMPARSVEHQHLRILPA